MPYGFAYRCTKGRGSGACRYEGEVFFEAPDLAEAMRQFKLWLKSQPEKMYAVKVTSIEQPATEPSQGKEGK